MEHLINNIESAEANALSLKVLVDCLKGKINNSPVPMSAETHDEISAIADMIEEKLTSVRDSIDQLELCISNIE